MNNWAIDSDEALKDIIRNAERIQNKKSASSDEHQLAAAVLALNGWIKSGGALPSEWSK